MSAAHDAGLRAVVAAAGRWVDALGLAARPLPGALAELRAAQRPLTMRTRRWTGGAFAALTIAEIEDDAGALCTATVIGLPAAGTLAPVVGVDLIALGGALSLVAVDLTPADPEFWRVHCEPRLAAMHAAVGEAAVPRRWPGFAVESFSPRALIAGARRGGEEQVLAAVAGLLRGLPAVLAEAEGEPERAAAAAERVRGWLAAERRNRKEQEALARLFGAEAAEAYLGEVFKE